MQDKLLVVLNEHFIHFFHVHLGAEAYSSQCLGFSAREDGGTVGAGQPVHIAPDRADFRCLAAVNPQAFIEHEVAQGFPLLVSEIAADHQRLFRLLFLGQAEGFDARLLDVFEAVLTLVFRLGGLGQRIAFVVAEIVNLLFDIFVFFITRILPLDILAEFLVEFFLDAAHGLDRFVSGLDRIQHDLFRDLVHFTLDHHDVLLRGGDNQVEVGLLHFGKIRIDLECPVDPGDPDFGNRSEERKVAGGQGGGCREPGERVRLDVLLRADQPHVHKDCEVEVFGEQRAQRPVDQSGDQHLVVGGPAFPFQESAGETPCGIILFPVVYLEGKEIGVFVNFLGTGHCGEEHGISHPDYC